MALRVIRRQTSNGSSATCNDNLRPFSRPKTLGDKLHLLAKLSPKHVVALELLVDQILKEVNVKLPLLLVLCLTAAACSGNDTPTTPTLAANVIPTGTLTTAACLPAGATLSRCTTFSGTAMNTGAGCASGVHGVITTYAVPGNGQIGSAGWSYTGPTVKAGESIAFTGGPLTVGVPLSGGWVYLNAITFDSVRC